MFRRFFILDKNGTPLFVYNYSDGTFSYRHSPESDICENEKEDMLCSFISTVSAFAGHFKGGRVEKIEFDKYAFIYKNDRSSGLTYVIWFDSVLSGDKVKKIMDKISSALNKILGRKLEGDLSEEICSDVVDILKKYEKIARNGPP